MNAATDAAMSSSLKTVPKIQQAPIRSHSSSLAFEIIRD
jgi:hypothetical protein